MIPQDSFTIVAKIRAGSIGALRSLLTTMNYENCAGFADPDNPLVRFGDFKTIHFARFVVLADNTLKDRAAYSHPPRDEATSDEPTRKEPSCKWPTYLCFMADCDGPADELLKSMTQNASRLREIFGHCEGCDDTTDMLGWLHAHRIQPMASYVNWVGRSVAQIRDEARLHHVLRDALSRTSARNPQGLFAELRDAAAAAGPLTQRPPTPFVWRIRNLTHMLVPLLVALACLVWFPVITIVLLAIAALLFFVTLRRHDELTRSCRSLTNARKSRCCVRARITTSPTNIPRWALSSWDDSACGPRSSSFTG